MQEDFWQWLRRQLDALRHWVTRPRDPALMRGRLLIFGGISLLGISTWQIILALLDGQLNGPVVWWKDLIPMAAGLLLTIAGVVVLLRAAPSSPLPPHPPGVKIPPLRVRVQDGHGNWMRWTRKDGNDPIGEFDVVLYFEVGKVDIQLIEVEVTRWVNGCSCYNGKARLKLNEKLIELREFRLLHPPERLTKETTVVGIATREVRAPAPGYRMDEVEQARLLLRVVYTTAHHDTPQTLEEWWEHDGSELRKATEPGPGEPPWMATPDLDAALASGRITPAQHSLCTGIHPRDRYHYLRFGEEFVRDQAQLPFTLERLREVHDILLQSPPGETAGEEKQSDKP